MARYKVHTFTSSNTFSVTSVTGKPSLDSIEYLIVAGGGGGGSGTSGYGGAGGGGAGGFRTSTSPVATGNYTIVVGGGGGSSGGRNVGGSGTLSSIAGSTITASPGPTPNTFISAGGGGGAVEGPNTLNGIPGGSGGGGSTWGSSSGTVGNGNNPPVSPPQGNPGGVGLSNNVWRNGGGGGGASQTGITAAQPKGGNGGAGANSSISGTEVTYAGGGGGGGSPGKGIGGAGGGGNGRNGPVVATAGTVNTGGGGGGGEYATTGAPGGSGIVIVRYPLADSNLILRPRIPIISDLTSNTNSVEGGGIVTFSISSVNATEGMTFYYDTVGNATVDSFVGGNTGSFAVSSNTATLAFTAITPSETKEFNLRVKRAASGPVLAVSNSITIPAVEFGGTSISKNELFLAEGVYLAVTTTGASANAAIIYEYEIEGTGALTPSSGNIIINNNIANIELVADGYIPEGETRQAQVLIKFNGNTIATSDAITIRKPPENTIEATGGTVLTTSTSKVHVFASTGPFTITSAPPSWQANLLVVAGGGTGAQDRWSSDRAAGGGGAGGMILTTIDSSDATIGSPYTMTVGAGGNGPSGNPGQGNSGSPSTAFGLTAVGGGGGGGHGNPPADTTPSRPGGSSGGIAYSPSATLGSSTPGQGNPGFNGSGGGGGAGEAGKPGVGGNGRSVVWFTNATYGETYPGITGQWFAGGGGGRNPTYPAFNSRGGLGGGGQGGGPDRASPPYNGQVNTGGGGGAIRGTSTPGLGGSGIIAIEYPGAFYTRRISLVSSVITPASIYESEAATVTVNTVSASNGEVLYYTTTGNAEIYSNAQGSFTINGNVGTFSVITDATVLPGQSRSFAVQIRRSSVSGTIIYTSDSIFVDNIAGEGGETGLDISGGTEIEIEI